jgi:predicted ATPase
LLKTDTKLDDDHVLDATEEAQAANLIEDISAQREARYRFVHEQIRQALLSGLSFPRRKRMHLRVARGLEQLPLGKIEKNLGAIANHFYRAGAGADSEKTVH